MVRRLFVLSGYVSLDSCAALPGFTVISDGVAVTNRKVRDRVLPLAKLRVTVAGYLMHWVGCTSIQQLLSSAYALGQP